MRRSDKPSGMIVADDSALQHEHAPRPLPLFLELVRKAAEDDPDLARDALTGLALYARAQRQVERTTRAEVARAGAASLRDHGGSGVPVVLVPSLINPPHILDLDDEVSLTSAIRGMGLRPLLVDWGDARQRLTLSVAGHVEQLLLPLLQSLEKPPILLGYCLGGTMALAAANLHPVRALVTLAAPWRFSAYPESGREALGRLWRDAQTGSRTLGVLPMEVLQASFWSLDPRRTVTKFAELKRLDPQAPQFRRFVALEDWANEGDPLPLPAARELLEDFFEHDLTGASAWQVGGAIMGPVQCPALHFTASHDRITPAQTAPEGPTVELPAGHVGMVVGRARKQLHAELNGFLNACR